MDKSSTVTRGDWSREWSPQRSDEAHVTTPGGPSIIELRRMGGPIVCNELSERRTESCEGRHPRPCRLVPSRGGSGPGTVSATESRIHHSPPFEQT